MKLAMSFIALFLLSNAVSGEKAQLEPRWTVGFNALETSAFLMGKLFVKKDLVFVPLHFDGSYMLTPAIGLGFGLVYRYENYGRGASKPFGEVTSLEELWTNYHELFLMAGPRLSIFGEGNRGWYGALKMGLGGALSSGGYAFTGLVQPELGYSWLLGDKQALQLDFALGVLLNLPIKEAPAVGFNVRNALGWVVHRTIPIIRIGIGFAF